MDIPFTTLVLTKLRPPAPRSRAIRRPRLLQKIELKPETDLILVSAPAGYGKTTLLVEWTRQLEQAGTGVAWIALEENDSHPLVFGTYLVTGLAQLLGAESGLSQVLQALRASPEIDLLKILPAIINAILAAGRETVLVLDDYHLIQSREIQRAIEFLIAHRPDNFHLAIGSRATPPLPLARLRARGRLVELHAADLRFTGEETERFLREAMGLALPAEVSSRISTQVEGWPAGLQLAAISASGFHDLENQIGAFSGGHKQLADYLLEEVVNRLPEEMQSFLLYTAILERMSAAVCDAMLGIEHSAALLQRIEAANLFVVALDEEGTWYRYHHLFRDFLRNWLKKTQPERISGLHRLACGWFAEHGSLREAAYHAFQCGDWAFVADFIEQHSFTLIIQSEIATIYEWTSAIPEALMQERPMLCIFQALALAFHFHGKNRRRVEARLQQADRKLAEAGDPNLSQMANELAGVVQPFLSMAPDPNVDAEKQLDLALARLAAYPNNDPGRFPWLLIAGYSLLALQRVENAEKAFTDALPFALQAGLFFGVVETTFHLARLAHSQGRLAGALQICQDGQEALAAALKGTNQAIPALGCLDIARADVLFEQDQLEEAERCLKQGMEHMGWGMNPYYLMTGWLAQFRLCLARDRLNEALSCMDQLDLMWPDIQFLTQGLRAQAMLRFSPGEAATQSAREWLQSYQTRVGTEIPLPGLGPIGAAEAFYQANLVWARLQIAAGDPQAALAYLARQLALARAQNLCGRAIELILLEAQAHRKLGNHAPAQEKLMEAFAAGQLAGYIRTFDQSSLLDDLIHEAMLQGRGPAYAGQLLAVVRAAKRTPQTFAAGQLARALPAEPLAEALSKRELEILQLMATGATNQQIAARLVITVGTAKSHINHILGKLNASNRTEAVAKARHNGLIEPYPFK